MTPNPPPQAPVPTQTEALRERLTSHAMELRARARVFSWIPQLATDIEDAASAMLAAETRERALRSEIAQAREECPCVRQDRFEDATLEDATLLEAVKEEVSRSFRYQSRAEQAEASISALREALKFVGTLIDQLWEGDDGTRPDRDFGPRTLHRAQQIIAAALQPEPRAAKETPTLGAPGGWLAPSAVPAPSAEGARRCVWCECDLTPPPTDRPYLTSAGKSICSRCIELFASLREVAPTAGQGAAPQDEAIDLAIRKTHYFLGFPIAWSDTADTARKIVEQLVRDGWRPRAHGPASPLAPAEPTVPASKIRALLADWRERSTPSETDADDATLRCAREVERLLGGRK